MRNRQVVNLRSEMDDSSKEIKRKGRPKGASKNAIQAVKKVQQAQSINLSMPIVGKKVKCKGFNLTEHDRQLVIARNRRMLNSDDDKIASTAINNLISMQRLNLALNTYQMQKQALNTVNEGFKQIMSKDQMYQQISQLGQQMGLGQQFIKTIQEKTQIKNQNGESFPDKIFRVQQKQIIIKPYDTGNLQKFNIANNIQNGILGLKNGSEEFDFNIKQDNSNE